MTLCSASSGKRTPLARPTAATSAEARANSGAMSASSRKTPIDVLVAAVSAELVANRMNFIHSSVTIWSLCVASKPAFRHSARKSSPRALWPPSSSPNIRRMKSPVCLITPGSAIVALICATPPITAGAPRMGIRRSAASMPFCNGITAVVGPISGRIDAPAVSTSQSLTQNSTRSTAPMVAGSSVACAGAIRVSPRPPSMRRPFARMACRWAPRATNVTSAPAFAKAPPNAPPTPPAPITAMRINRTPIRAVV